MASIYRPLRPPALPALIPLPFTHGRHFASSTTRALDVLQIPQLDASPFLALVERLTADRHDSRQTWRVIAHRLDGLAASLSPSQAVRVCASIAAVRRDVLLEDTGEMANLMSKLRTSARSLSGSELAAAVSVLVYSRRFTKEMQAVFNPEVSARLTGLDLPALVDIGASYALLKAKAAKNLQLWDKTWQTENLPHRISRQIIQRMPDIAALAKDNKQLTSPSPSPSPSLAPSDALICRAIHAAAHLDQLDFATRNTLKKHLVDALPAMDMSELKLFPSAMHAIGSRDPELFNRLLSSVLTGLSVGQWSGRDLFSLNRRAALLQFDKQSEDDSAPSSGGSSSSLSSGEGGDTESGSHRLAHHLLSTCLSLPIPGLIAVVDGCALSSANHQKEQEGLVKDVSEAIAFKVTAQLPRLTNAASQGPQEAPASAASPEGQRVAREREREGASGGHKALMAKEFAQLMLSLSELRLPRQHKTVKVVGEHIDRVVGGGPHPTAERLGAFDMDDLTSLALAVANLTQLGYSAADADALHGRVKGLMEERAVEMMTDEQVRRLTNTIRRMEPNTAEAISGYCELLCYRLSVQDGPSASAPPPLEASSIAHILLKTLDVLRKHGLRREMQLLLLKATQSLADFLVQAEEQCSLASLGLSERVLAHMLMVCSILIEEVSYGDPLRGQAVGCLATIARRAGRAAVHVPLRYVTESFLDALPVDADEVRAYLLRVKRTSTPPPPPGPSPSATQDRRGQQVAMHTKATAAEALA
ncbi:unnamed protein product [Vitrella brassicaformis CCMP3155]|uniref:Uncharacterized protein n=1 Tax=Vitrella brassicaformis (strain CCMP3155) TaxID=1169540 RepID=A0A0G4GLD8_VITBC|nr:unnamed protein product [Vitrella brassicaformis CCMP3155]|eukprot:CEM30849.1 unnamed protein product [Vitrella brassicaformis CCMP3155]